MKINKIEFNNFRQFHGEQELALATDARRNVTLVHAENGFGKTTILNAVLWALFNKLTSKFEQPEKIVNFESLAEGNRSATVEVSFEFKGRDYLVARSFNAAEDKRDRTRLAASWVDRGVLKPLPAPETFISSVVPPEMAKYFFFDGEAAEAFSAATNFKEIGQAIRNIVGSSLADTALLDLKELSKQIDKQIGQVPGDVELQQIEQRISTVITSQENFDEMKTTLEADIATFIAQRDDITEKLRTMAGAKEIQARRDEKNRDLEQVTTEIKTTLQEIIKWIGQKSLAVVSRRLAQETLDFIDEASIKGRIPSPYNEEFVKGLLAAEVCICHRPIKAETAEWKAVAELLRNASNAETMGRVVRARARVSQLREEATEAPKSLLALQTKYGQLFDNRRRLEQQIVELGNKIQNLPLEEIAERERSRQKLDHKIQEKNQKLGVVRNKLYDLGNEKQRLDQDLERVARKNKGATRLLNRRNLLLRSGEFLAGLLEQYESSARKQIQDQINGILKEVAHRDYVCRLNDNFSIELMFSNGLTAPKSGGENQLLSLVFIASLVKFAASRIDDENLILKPGTVAPLVLDAPFGQLDTDYQESTASYIPQLAEQVVLLVSSSQGNEKVLQALNPYIGAEYVLISENRETRGSKSETRLALHGKEHVCSLFNQSRTMTRIERIG